MPASKFIRRGLIGAAILLCVMVVAVAGLIAALDAGHFRGALVGYVERATERKISVSGALRAELFSLHPRISAEGVTIGNPPWTPAGVTAHIDFLTFQLEVPRWDHPMRIDALRLQGAQLTLFRDAAGHANWQRRDPGKKPGKGLPLFSSLSMGNAQVSLDDQRRHLNFKGIVSAQDAKNSDGSDALQIQGSGQLNGNPVTLELAGEPLAGATHDRPYHFSFSENSTGSHLTAKGSLPKPFDFGLTEATFEASGADLKDLYFLTGVNLVNTGAYRISGKYVRDGDHTRFDDLHLATGQSDVRGSLAIESKSGRPHTDAKLNAHVLRLADFGLRAAGRETQNSGLLVSNAALNPDALRRGDGQVQFQARQVLIGRQVLNNFAAALAIERGMVTVAPVSAEFLGGKLNGKVKIDATQDNPPADVDLTMAGLQLAQWPHQSADAPFEGAMAVRLKVSGHGKSAHQIAAAAEGTLSATLPQGTMRDSLAELAGMDLRGLGLTLGKSKRDTPVRCAAADFLAHAGVFTLQHMVVDTEAVRIDGEGSVHMDSEALDLVFRGEPKSLRVLRLKAPLLVRGTLAQPSITIEKENSKLMLVDRGRAKDEDCAALVK
jgi:AsmA family protein